MQLPPIRNKVEIDRQLERNKKVIFDSASVKQNSMKLEQNQKENLPET
jgi:hypothetical protein